MEIILLERIEKLGQMGDVVTVKSGYARNYLLPQNKALRATEENRAYFDSQRKEIEAKNLAGKKEAETVAKKLKGQSIVLIRQAGETDQLYGSVTTRDIAAELSDQGVRINRSQVILPVPIKALGIHEILVRLHPEVTTEISVNVARTEEEANKQKSKPAKTREAAEAKEIFESEEVTLAAELSIAEAEAKESGVDEDLVSADADAAPSEDETGKEAADADEETKPEADATDAAEADDTDSDKQ